MISMSKTAYPFKWPFMTRLLTLVAKSFSSGWLILGFGVLAEECAGCDHRTPVRWQIMAFLDGVWLLQWPA